MDKLNELRAKVEELRSEIARLSEIDNITPDDDARLSAALEEFETRKGELDEAEIRAARIEAAKSATVERAVGFDPPQVIKKVGAYDVDLRSARGGELRDHARRILDDKKVTHHLTNADLAKVERLTATLGDKHNQHFIATMRPEYRSAFGKMMSGRDWAIEPDERRALEEVRAWSVGTDSAVIPELFDPTVIASNDGVVNPIRQVSRIVTGTADVWEGITSAGVTASWDAEATEVSDDDPAFVRPTITAHKAAAFVPFSIEFGGDWEALGSEVVRMFADAKDRLEGTGFATGSGSSQPYGIVTALDANTNVEVTPTTDGSFGVEDIYKVWAALPARWRPNATWMMPLSTTNRVRQFGTSTNYHGYTVDLTETYGFRLLGRPAYENSSMADTATLTTGALNLLIVGDFSQYVIYDRIGMGVELIPHLFSTGSGRPTGSRGYYAYWRVGADSIVDTAFRLLQNQ